MAEKIKRDYNILALEGITDQDYVNDFGVPQELANTPGINKWLIQDTYDKNRSKQICQASSKQRS